MSLSVVWLIIIFLVIQMSEARIYTVQQAREVLAGTHECHFKISDADGQRYAWVGSVLRRFGCARLHRIERGVVLAYDAPGSAMAGCAGASIAQTLSRGLIRVPALLHACSDQPIKQSGNCDFSRLIPGLEKTVQVQAQSCRLSCKN